ncbi:YjbF family lipoprotein [Cognatishimia sp. F0-27]|uniref:YjbF family lipoprotein n=1 Tax=Cognatishimia sp. F0-27 TaxID=2816855 RepID=UPI001D0C2548|nr:YjbF family lipoprotein [Cognatishimia sp. F0-27]MCC1492394.1 YjbF family lipoprotein [Cognatishimia sp. F0-27]
MIGTGMIRTALTVLLTASLAACSSQDTGFGEIATAVRENIANRGENTEVRGLDTNAVSAALAATDRPLSLMQSEEPVQQFIMVDIARNGPYRTYATSTREAVITRGGMITSTRGLGGDLMSSEEDALYRLIGSRIGGSAPYTLRHLTPEGVTETTQYQCQVSRGAASPVQIGELNTSGLVMTAQCRSDAGAITNTFLVDGNGQILSARQFISDYYGYLTTQVLRR